MTKRAQGRSDGKRPTPMTRTTRGHQFCATGPIVESCPHRRKQAVSRIRAIFMAGVRFGDGPQTAQASASCSMSSSARQAIIAVSSAARDPDSIECLGQSGYRRGMALLGPPPSTGAACDMRSSILSNWTCSSTRIRRDCGDRSKEEVHDETVITDLQAEASGEIADTP